jgi:hypothetical protein
MELGGQTPGSGTWDVAAGLGGLGVWFGLVWLGGRVGFWSGLGFRLGWVGLGWVGIGCRFRGCSASLRFCYVTTLLHYDVTTLLHRYIASFLPTLNHLPPFCLPLLRNPLHSVLHSVLPVLHAVLHFVLSRRPFTPSNDNRKGTTSFTPPSTVHGHRPPSTVYPSNPSLLLLVFARFPYA